MNWTAADARRAREYTNRLVEMAEDGLIDWESLARDLLGYLSEADVRDFARSNDYVE